MMRSDRGLLERCLDEFQTVFHSLHFPERETAKAIQTKLLKGCPICEDVPVLVVVSPHSGLYILLRNIKEVLLTQFRSVIWWFQCGF